MCPDGFLLALADETRLAVCGLDEYSRRVVRFLAEAARLSPAPSPLPPGVRHLMVVESDAAALGIETSPDDVVCVMAPLDVKRPRRRPRVGKDGLFVEESPPPPVSEEQRFWGRLMRLSGAVARETHPRGGALIHGGLIETPFAGRDGRGGGILLAGRSGVGKTTACMRVPAPWRCLCDDITLVLRSAEGLYAAHPWPTWSAFFGPEKRREGVTWDMQTAIPLRAAFVVEQGDEDRVEPLGQGHAVCLLTELARQPSEQIRRGMTLEELGPYSRLLFSNLCELVKAVPCYTLWVHRDGAFWHEIERVLGMS